MNMYRYKFSHPTKGYEIVLAETHYKAWKILKERVKDTTGYSVGIGLKKVKMVEGQFLIDTFDLGLGDFKKMKVKELKEKIAVFREILEHFKDTDI